MSKLGPWEIITQHSATASAGIVRVMQVHGGDIVWASEAEQKKIIADGIVARHDFKQPFMITTADCLPLVLVCKTIACALHVSRKTLIRGLLDRVPDFILPDSIIGAWIGPHVCSDHFVFEWMGEDIAAFANRFPGAYKEKEDGIHLSTLAATKQYLNGWGVAEQIIQYDQRCTYEEVSLPSYRRTLRDKQELVEGLATIVRAI